MYYYNRKMSQRQRESAYSNWKPEKRAQRYFPKWCKTPFLKNLKDQF